MTTSCISVGRVGRAVLLGSGLLVGGLLGYALPRPAAAVVLPPPAPATAWPDSLDALVAASQFHRVLFENERVRVLEVTVPPHQREPLHTHQWPSVMYRPAGPRGSGRYYNAAGQLVHEFSPTGKPGVARARWQEPEGPHAVENTGSVADQFIRVELKPGPAGKP